MEISSERITCGISGIIPMGGTLEDIPGETVKGLSKENYSKKYLGTAEGIVEGIHYEK